MKRKGNPPWLRKLVHDRQAGKCIECGQDLGARWELHHILAVAEGGAELDPENCEGRCLACHKPETAALAKRLAKARRRWQKFNPAGPGRRKRQRKPRITRPWLPPSCPAEAPF